MLNLEGWNSNMKDKRPRRRRTPDSTAALRGRLKADHQAGKLQDSEFYVRWLIDLDEELGRIPARRIVSRELRPFQPATKPASKDA